MGIQGLIPFLDKVSTRINVAQYKDCCVAVDAYCWLHKGAYTCAEKLARGEKCDAYVYYCMKYVNMLLSYNIKPILVFDGRHLPAKAGTEKKRRESRARNRRTATELLNAGRVDEARNYLRRCVDVSHAMALALIQECRKINVDCIVAPYEADAQLAYLNLQNIAEVVITEDSDLILFGCSKIVFKLDLQGCGLLVERDRLHLSMGVRAENFSFDSFRYMCILSGCDYLPSLPGIGLNKALKFISKTKDPDIHRALRRMPSYLNMTQLKVSEEYRDSFVSADATFRYQPVFDPRSRCLIPLLEPPEGEEPPAIVNEQLHPNVALNLALGNLDPFTLERVDNFNPDCPQQGVAGLQRRSWGYSPASSHPSIWSRDFPGFQPLPEKKQCPAMLNCTAVLDVTPLHMSKGPQATGSEPAEEHTLPSPAELESMYGSNGSALPNPKRQCSLFGDNACGPSHSPEHDGSRMSVSYSKDEMQQQPLPTSPILNPRRSRNPFAKPKQMAASVLGPPGATGCPNYFSALRKFDGIYPLEVDSGVSVVSRYFRSFECADKMQPINLEKETEAILKDVSNTSCQISIQNSVLEEENIFNGYSCDKENGDLNYHLEESVLTAIEAIQNEVSSPSQSPHPKNADKDEKISMIEKMEVEIEEVNVISRQQAESNSLRKNPAPSFNWSQFSSRRSLSSFKLTSSQAVSQTFKNPFRKRSVSKNIGLMQQINGEKSKAGNADPQLTPTAIQTQETLELSRSPRQIARTSSDDIFNCYRDESEKSRSLKDSTDTSTFTSTRGPCGGEALTRAPEEVVEPSEGSPWQQQQEGTKAEDQALSCGSSDSGYQGSQDTPESGWRNTEEKGKRFSSHSAANGRSTPMRHRLAVRRSSVLGQAVSKQNLLVEYGFSKKRKLSH